MNSEQTNFRRRVAVGCVVALMCASGGYFLVGDQLKFWVKKQLVIRYNRSAQAYLDQNDPPNALLLARRGLQRLPDDLDSWKIAAEATRRLNRPEATFYQQNLTRLSPSKSNFLELIRSCVHYGQDTAAIDAIKRGAPFLSKEPEYYRLAAKTYTRQGQAVAAKYFLMDLLVLQPDDTTAQLDLARIEIGEDSARKNTGPRTRLKALAEIAELRGQALAILLDDSLRAKQVAESYELSQQLTAVPSLNLEERLLVVKASLLRHPEQSNRALQPVFDHVSGDSNSVARTLDFMVTNGRAADAATWHGTLGIAIQQSEPVRRAATEMFLRLENWEKLRDIAQSGTWSVAEYLRHAYLAYSYKSQGRTTEFDEAWEAAVLATGQSVGNALNLLSRVKSWHWQRERFDVLWRLFSLIPESDEIRNTLLAWERAQGNTANLNRIFVRMMEVDPADRIALNNFAYSSLLLDANVNRASMIAKELTSAAPDNPFFATTFAMALFKEGNAAEALQQLEKLRYSDLAQPERMTLHSVLLSRTGQYTRAEEIAGKIVKSRLLPEERRLAETAELEVSRHQRSQNARSEIAAKRVRQPANDRGWLSVMGPAIQDRATEDMKLADSLYAGRDLKKLGEFLNRIHWQNDDYLRHALIAYCRRNENPAASREAWSRAVSSTQGDNDALEHLQTLAAHWMWTSERMEAMSRLHLASPANRDRLEELVRFYRERKRTLDLIRVLRPTGETAQVPHQIAYLYYALLANVETSEAIVAAKNGYEAHPDDTDWQVVYAFSLWRQQRAREAESILKAVATDNSNVLPVALVRAVVEAELGQMDRLRKLLDTFDKEKALPEETELCRKIALRLTAKQ